MDDRSPARHRATGLSLAALLLVLGAFLALVALHLLRSDLDPVREVMSGYANGEFGLLMTIAFYALGIGSIILAFRLPRATERDWSARLVSVLLSLAGLGLVLAGIFEVERPAIPDTIEETIHSNGAIVGFVLIVGAMLLFSYVCSRDPRWRSFLPWAATLSVLAVVGAAFSPMAAGTAFGGLAQRVLGGIVFGWVLLVSGWIRFHADLHPSRSVPAE